MQVIQQQLSARCLQQHARPGQPTRRTATVRQCSTLPRSRAAIVTRSNASGGSADDPSAAPRPSKNAIAAAAAGILASLAAAAASPAAALAKGSKAVLETGGAPGELYAPMIALAATGVPASEWVVSRLIAGGLVPIVITWVLVAALNHLARKAEQVRCRVRGSARRQESSASALELLPLPAVAQRLTGSQPPPPGVPSRFPPPHHANLRAAAQPRRRRTGRRGAHRAEGTGGRRARLPADHPPGGLPAAAATIAARLMLSACRLIGRMGKQMGVSSLFAGALLCACEFSKLDRPERTPSPSTPQQARNLFINLDAFVQIYHPHYGPAHDTIGEPRVLAACAWQSTTPPCMPMHAACMPHASSNACKPTMQTNPAPPLPPSPAPNPQTPSSRRRAPPLPRSTPSCSASTPPWPSSLPRGP